VTIRELQSSIKNLFATGNFRDVRVDAAPADGGVVLTFALYLHYRIGAIELEGLPKSERSRAQRELTVQRRVLARRRRRQRERGAGDAAPHTLAGGDRRSETNFDRARSIADVKLHVTAGPLARIADVILTAISAPFTTQQLIGRMKCGSGEVFSVGEAREDANRMRNFLVRRDYRCADVDLVGNVYDDASKTVTLRYRVNMDPIVKVGVEAARRAVRRWLPFARSQEYSEDAVDQAADNIVRGLQERGHYNAAVDTESELQDNVWTTTFHVGGTRGSV
jgi:outer membrane protein assembly factor BamA